MRDQDLGEMFLLFHLHPNTVKFTGVDLGPLEFGAKDCAQRWMCWTRNLMGFKASPYNSIGMYLVSEEIIRGDQHDTTNAFQWTTILLNLPGTKGYRPALAWISKRHSSTGTLGLYDECRCWWNWSGNCAPVKRRGGIFCANFCEPRGSWPA